jgi:hypothetical protein
MQVLSPKCFHLRGPQGAWRDDKRLEICTAGLEFESRRAPLARD